MRLASLLSTIFGDYLLFSINLAYHLSVFYSIFNVLLPLLYFLNRFLEASFCSSAYAEIYSNPYSMVRIKNDAFSYLITKLPKVQNEFSFRDWALTEIARTNEPLTNEQVNSFESVISTE